jgi:hypothetical protein
MVVNLALKASKLSTEGDAFRTGIEKVNKWEDHSIRTRNNGKKKKYSTGTDNGGLVRYVETNEMDDGADHASKYVRTGMEDWAGQPWLKEALASARQKKALSVLFETPRSLLIWCLPACAPPTFSCKVGQKANAPGTIG